MQCPSLCSNCTASGRCLRCNDGYSLQAGRCVKCSVRGCTRCSEDPSVCERCQTGNHDWVDGSLGLKEGKCVRCQDPNCSDCGSNWAKCRACVGPGSYSNGTVLKDGKCVQVSMKCTSEAFAACCSPHCEVRQGAYVPTELPGRDHALDSQSVFPQSPTWRDVPHTYTPAHRGAS